MPRKDGDAFNLTYDQMAAALHVSKATMVRYKRQGCPVEEGPRRKCLFSYNKTVEWLRNAQTPQGRSPKAAALAWGETGTAPKPDPTQLVASDVATQRAIKRATLLNKKLDAAKKKRLEEEALGNLIERERVLAEHSRAVRIARDRLMTLPGSLAAKISGMTGYDPVELEKLIETTIEHSLRSLSQETIGI